MNVLCLSRAPHTHTVYASDDHRSPTISAPVTTPTTIVRLQCVRIIESNNCVPGKSCASAILRNGSSLRLWDGKCVNFIIIRNVFNSTINHILSIVLCIIIRWLVRRKTAQNCFIICATTNNERLLTILSMIVSLFSILLLFVTLSRHYRPSLAGLCGHHNLIGGPRLIVVDRGLCFWVLLLHATNDIDCAPTLELEWRSSENDEWKREKKIVSLIEDNDSILKLINSILDQHQVEEQQSIAIDCFERWHPSELWINSTLKIMVAKQQPEQQFSIGSPRRDGRDLRETLTTNNV